WNLVASLEVVFSRSLNEVIYRNINLKNAGSLNPELSGDRRPLYGVYMSSPLWNPGRGHWAYSRHDTSFTSVILLSNADVGSSLHNTLQIQREPDGDGVFLSVAYTNGSARDVNSGISDQAYAQWRYNPAFDPNNPRVEYSAFDRKHKVVAAASYRFEWSHGWAATLGAVYTGLSGQPFSYVYDGDLNGDGEPFNDLFYVPGRASELLLIGGDGMPVDPRDTGYTQLFTFIQQDEYLSARRGNVVERNGARTPWSDQLDVRAALEIPLANGRRLEVHAELFNVLNLIDPDLGIVHYAPSSIIPIMRLYDIDPIGRPRFQWARRDGPLVPESMTSRWRLRLGMRYTL
ncbi:MAG TPA: hypothetical protein VLT13_05780, partial [Bacteroidota bacterium]|nr:hypothetical protein [Bacteroidota bacterium]